MAMISTFSKFVLLFVSAHVTSALNSPVPVVHTVSNVTLISGKEASLTCDYNRTLYAVYWRYESTTSPMELLVVRDEYYHKGEKSGPGFEKGRFDITDDHSLIIHDVEAADEGKYICEVSDYETGKVFRNHTDVTTIVKVERPFVLIEQCEDDVPADAINEPCVLHSTSEDRTVQLSCTVVGAKPVVVLTWEASMSSEHWKQVMNESTLITRDRGNGIFDQTLTVDVDSSYIKSNKQHFTCVAKGLAVDGVANLTIAVYYAQGVNVKLAVLFSVLCILVFIIVIMGVLWKVCLRDKWGRRSAALRKKINKINNMNVDEPVYLGVIGDEDAGKSSFIKSLKYLIQGPNASVRNQSSEGADADNSIQIWECTEFISEGLRIRQMCDRKKFKPEEIPTILKSEEEDIPSSSSSINMETSDLIHLPIFVFDISNKDDLENRIKLLHELCWKVFSHIEEYPMLVLTKASPTTHKKELKELMKKIWIPRENILVTFHYLDSDVKFDNHERGELLDFILECVATVDKQKSIRKRLRTWWKRRLNDHYHDYYMSVQLNDTSADSLTEVGKI